MATANKLLPPKVFATVLDCCLEHPEWGTPEGARLQGEVMRRYEDGLVLDPHAEPELAEVTLGEAGVGRYLVPSESWTPSGEVLSGVVFGDHDFVVDVIARRFDPDLPFPLVLPCDEWYRLMHGYTWADDAA